MRLKIGLILTLVWITGIGSAAESGSKPASRLIADFTIVRTLSALSDKITSTGKLYLGGPGLLKWETESPSKSVLVINQQQAWIHYPDFKVTKSFDVNSDPVMNVLTEHLLVLTRGDLDRIATLYEVTELIDGTKQLVPKEASVKKIFKEIRVRFGSKGAVSSVEMVARNGDLTAITFRNVRLNPSIPPEVFEKPVN